MEKTEKKQKTVRKKPIVKKADNKAENKNKSKGGAKQNQKPKARVNKTLNSKKKQKNLGKLKIIPLGGLGEIGRNITAVEYKDDIIVIDCGIGFPDDDMLGIDLVCPDVTYLEKNIEKVRGIFLTHGHEDHIGALPYVLPKIPVPVYGTRLTLGIVEIKLAEHKLNAQLNCVSAGEHVRAGVFDVEFIRVNHSIADSVAFCITTPLGKVIFTGDFKIDLTPIEGEMIDLTRFGELGRSGVLALLSDSTNAERPGFTPTERKVGKSFENIFEQTKKRIVIATFSSNVHRIQQIVYACEKHSRKLAITGRSMINILTAATRLGYVKIPDGMLIDISAIKRYKPEELVIVTTGSQGEPMSALSRMANASHPSVQLGMDDLVVLSSSPIPGNEKMITKIINELLKKGVEVVYDQTQEVHVSGHACQEELKFMQALTKPKYFLPLHGEFKHQVKNAELAEYVGIPRENIFIPEEGSIFEIDSEGARFNGTVPVGKLLIDGNGIGDVGNVVLRDRRHLSMDGLIVVVVGIAPEGFLVTGPDIVSRGFVYVKESEELMEEIKALAKDAVESSLEEGNADWGALKGTIKDTLGKFLYQRTKRRPMILPVVIEV